jgi:hypothetical protein
MVSSHKKFWIAIFVSKTIPVGFNFSIDTHVLAKHSVSFIFLFIMEADFFCKSLKILQYEI